MKIKSKSKESLKALYTAFEDVIKKMGADGQERVKSKEAKSSSHS